MGAGYDREAYETSFTVEYAGGSPCGIRIAAHRLRDHADAHLGASGDLPEPFSTGSGIGEPGTNPPGHVPECSLAGLGFAGSESRRQHAWATDGDLDLCSLRNVSRPLLWTVRSVWTRLRLRRRRLCGEASPRRTELWLFLRRILRPVLLLLYSAEHSLSVSDNHLRQWQGCMVSIPGAAVSLIKIRTAACA